MTTYFFDHPWLKGLFADAEMASIWAPERQMAHMLAFEASWSRGLGAVGLADAEVAENAAQAIEGMTVDFEDIAAGMAKDGVPIPRLVKQMKAVAGEEAVHKGATSQDVVDTALVLTLRETSDLLAAKLEAVSSSLSALEARFGDAPLMGRTRMQAATEMTVRDRLEAWRLPFESHLARLHELRPRVERVQVGGASGDRKALGDKSDVMVRKVAQSLDLAPTTKAWHAMRDGIGEYASFLSLVSGSLGKIGQDICLMAQQGIGDIQMSGGGGSSAMPHKQNPVLPELLVTLARFNAVQVSAMHQALIHEQERSGTAWTLEWMVLPQMAEATGRALTAALDIFDRIERIGGAD